MRLVLSILVVFFYYTVSFATINDGAQPLQYPAGVITTSQPYFIWCDIYNTQSKPFAVLLKIISSKGQSKEFTLYPEVIDGMYCTVQAPYALTPDTYTYTIELLHNQKPQHKRYYHYKKYPVEGTFTIDTTQQNPVDALDKAHLIYYLSQNRLNTLHNGYNALFFSTSGGISLGSGIAIYYLTNFGVVTTVLSAVTITSGVIGITAGIYYGFRYYQTKQTIDNAIKISEQ